MQGLMHGQIEIFCTLQLWSQVKMNYLDKEGE